MTPHIVENNVEVLLADLILKNLNQLLIGLTEVNGRVRSQARQRFEDLSVPARRNDPSRTQMLCDLNGKLSSNPSRTEDQDRLTALEPCSPNEGEPRR